MKEYVVGNNVSVLDVSELSLLEINKLVIPKNVVSIKGSFSLVNGLERVYYEGDILDWCMIDFECDYSNPATTNACVYISGEILEKIKINVNELKKYTFSGFSSLKEVVIGKEVESIPPSSFNKCVNLSKFICDESDYFSVVDDCLYSKDMKRLYKFPPAKMSTSFSVSNCYILPYAFADVSYLKELEIVGIETIGPYALAYATSIEKVVMSDDVVEIGNAAFYMMDNLINVRISDNLKIIRTFGFMGCLKLEHIYLPETIALLEKCAFKYNPLLKIHFEYERLMFTDNQSWNHDNSEIIFKFMRRK